MRHHMIIGSLFICHFMFSNAQPKNRAPRSKQRAHVKYSCPMHPEVTKKSKGKCPKCGMALSPAEKKTATAVAEVSSQYLTKASSKMNIPDIELLHQH